MNVKRQFALGLFFVATLSILGYYTLFLTDFTLFSERVETTVYFHEGGGLLKGDAVLVTGIRGGKVKRLEYDREAPTQRRVTVTLLLDDPLELREGFRIRIEDASLLGGKQVAIDPGPAEGLPVDPDLELFGTIAANALEGLGEMVDENRERVEGILDNLETATLDARELLSGVRAGRGAVGRAFTDEEMAQALSAGIADAAATFDNASAIIAGVREGRGLIGQLFQDEGLRAKTDEIVERLRVLSGDLQGVVDDVRAGKGAVGMAFVDQEVAQDLKTGIRRFREIGDKISEGQGTVARLLNNDAIARDAEELMANLNRGDGTLPRLLREDEIYDKLDLVADDLMAISTRVREGRGTVGRLLVEEGVYEDLERALSVVNRTLEEFRETAPITTFTSVLFGAF